jgi:hypothetical protein
MHWEHITFLTSIYEKTFGKLLDAPTRHPARICSNQFGSETEFTKILQVFNLHLRHFLTSDDNYGHDVLFGPEKEIGGEGNITVFRLSTKLSDTSTNNKIMACADDMRAAADAFPQFNISTYTPMWNLADQFEIILPQTLQNLAIDLGMFCQNSLSHSLRRCVFILTYV